MVLQSVLHLLACLLSTHLETAAKQRRNYFCKVALLVSFGLCNFNYGVQNKAIETYKRHPVVALYISKCLLAYKKVNKSKKHFFLKLHCPKTKRNIWQNSALEFCLIFRSFFGQWSFKKSCFWDILTFSTHLETTAKQSSSISVI